MVVASVDDCVALSRHYDRFMTTNAQLANIIKLRVFVWGGLTALVFASMWWLAHVVHP
jgi:hypothetical protein